MRDNTLAYTLVTPGGTAVGESTPTSTMWVEECNFHADTIMDRNGRPQAYGSSQMPGTKDGGVWSSTWRLIGNGATIAANEILLTRALHSLIRGTGTLQWTTKLGSAQRLPGLQLLADDSKIDGTSKVWQIQLAAERPAAEDLNATVINSVPLTDGGGGFTIPLTIPFTLVGSSGGTLQVENVGNFDAWPVLRAYGPIDNPRITNLSTGESLVFNGSIAAGDYWEIDLFAQTVLLNGVIPVNAINDALSDWFSIGITGPVTLQYSGNNYSTSTLLRAYMRSGWG